jgi:selenocysteine-specific elongation factor
MIKPVILGTAGHIDHGKTAFVKALTGIDTDRLKEEKERGITIELGFAYLQLPGGQMLGIVDVPGHERFVKHMLAGATGIDLVALIIAADEGVMPQTREHLEICQLLKIKQGLVVLTKADLVDPDWLVLVKEDVAKFLAGTFLENSPLVEFSALTGQGRPAVVQTIAALVKDLPSREIGHFFRLPIDRVFSMKGFGTVITGTCISGEIRTGDEIAIYPGAIESRIRGIQVHNREVNEVRAGLRTAINLQGLEKAQVERGDIAAAKGSLHPTRMLDAVLELLPSAPHKIKNRTKTRFHIGTAEIMANVVLLDCEELLPGQRGFVQIRLERPTVAIVHDRYVLRSYSPVRTIGGGEIINALPQRKKRFSEAALQELRILSGSQLDQRLEQHLRLSRYQGLEKELLLFLTDVGRRELDKTLQALLARKRIIAFDKEVFVHAELLAALQEACRVILIDFHKSFPLKPGFSKEELRSRSPATDNPRLFNYLINQWVREGGLVQEKDLVRLSGHKVTLAQDQEKVHRQIAELYQKSGLQPPYFKEIEENFAGRTGADVLAVMVKEGILVKVKEDLYFHREAIQSLEQKLIAFLKANERIDMPGFKELTHVSRKYSVPLLEYFDLQHLTVRVGDTRVLRRK